MRIAIEFGGCEFRSLRRDGGRLLARRASTDYLVVQADQVRTRLIERQAEQFARCQDGMIVYGPTAVDLAELMHIPMQSALADGRLRHDDPVSRQFLGALVEGLLPQPQSIARCAVIACPANPDRPPLEDEELGFLLRLVKLRGYEPEVISPGMALALTELGEAGGSAVAVKLGGTQVDVSVIHETREWLRFTLPRGGVHLDRNIAHLDDSFLRLHDGREALNMQPIRSWRHQVQSLNLIQDPRTLELRNQYRELAYLVLHRLRSELTPTLRRGLPSPLPLVLGGALAAPVGTDLLFSQVAKTVDLPIQLAPVRQLHDAHFAALRGGLIQLDRLANGRRRKAAA
ncbi:MAG: hypothetical protein ACE37I_05015 [Rubinisphaera brasiliensis]|uniref:hypothetical protein n=1 Tax=Rubinisphaera brasiliensis TaxID=119 RepID=UPI0039188FAB